VVGKLAKSNIAGNTKSSPVFHFAVLIGQTKQGITPKKMPSPEKLIQSTVLL
jgi:hypothetical protein